LRRFLFAGASCFVDNTKFTKDTGSGCGSGIISAVIKNNTQAKITGIDINPHAAKCTKENGVDAIRGDLLSCIRGKFDMIIFNPPYLPTKNDERTGDWINVALDAEMMGGIS